MNKAQMWVVLDAGSKEINKLIDDVLLDSKLATGSKGSTAIQFNDGSRVQWNGTDYEEEHDDAQATA